MRQKGSCSLHTRAADISSIAQKGYEPRGLSAPREMLTSELRNCNAPRQATATKQAIIALFLARFTLTEAETQAVTSREVPVARALFDAMDRIEQIRSDCRVLLSGEEGETIAG